LIRFFLFLTLPFLLIGECKKATPNAFKLKIIETEIEVKGKKSSVFDVVGEDGSKIIERREGDCFNLIVENQTSSPTALHWHGVLLPSKEDGVPFVTQKPIDPGSSYPYNFKVIQSGSYYAHSHFGLQEQMLMTIPMVFLPKKYSPHRDIILFLEDFSFKTPREIWRNLRREYVKEAKKLGLEHWMPSFKSSMKKSHDLNDVDYDAFLTNRKTLENPDVYDVEPGETVRLRVMNASTSSQFFIFPGKLKAKLIAVDGNPIHPISFSEYELATAQRIDLLLKVPKEEGAYPVLARGQGTNQQTGLILKTKNAKVPSLSSKTKNVIGAITNSFEKRLRAKEPLKSRKIDRRLRVTLDGNMKDYVWGMNSQVWPQNKPLYVKEGERVEITFVNNTSMSHPMHLHGHVFQVTEIEGKEFKGAVRDTILVMPYQTVKVEFDAVHPGIWAFHCHIAYHLWAGMFTVLQYEGFTPPHFSKKEVFDYSRIYGGYGLSLQL